MAYCRHVVHILVTENADFAESPFRIRYSQNTGMQDYIISIAPFQNYLPLMFAAWRLPCAHHWAFLLGFRGNLLRSFAVRLATSVRKTVASRSLSAPTKHQKSTTQLLILAESTRATGQRCSINNVSLTIARRHSSQQQACLATASHSFGCPCIRQSHHLTAAAQWSCACRLHSDLVSSARKFASHNLHHTQELISPQHDLLLCSFSWQLHMGKGSQNPWLLTGHPRHIRNVQEHLIGDTTSKMARQNGLAFLDFEPA